MAIRLLMVVLSTLLTLLQGVDARTLAGVQIEITSQTTITSLSGVSTVVGSGTATAGSFGVERVLCPTGTLAVGGGVDLENVLTMTVTSSGPTFEQNNNRLIFQPNGVNPAPIGWQASARNDDTTTKSFKVAVICSQIEFKVFLPVVMR